MQQLARKMSLRPNGEHPLKSRMLDSFREEIAALVEAADGRPLKSMSDAKG
jgi:hypothetical protein